LRAPFDAGRALCTGKTVDMPWMAEMERVAQVVGVEGIAKAVKQFNDETPQLNMRRKVRAFLSPPRMRVCSRHGCVPEVTTLTGGVQLTVLQSTFTSFHGKKITMLQGDFFKLDVNAAGGQVDRVWDRGSLVAIEPTLRER
jgi:hypothetical protein